MFRRFGFTLPLCLLLISRVATQASPWPVVPSDLPPDPEVRWGSLTNGLRYAILPNAEPRDRVSLRLLVSVGSLHERDDERGLAHFLEHMAFRGTRAHPAGSLGAALQRLGMGMGPDHTAFTNYDYTIYHLELPDSRPATLREGLGVFREYAENITFDPALIERERGVILSEKATRNTPDARAQDSNLQFLWPDSRHARRAVIGLDESIRSLTRAQFIEFYDAWYRPERMAVIIVGNVTRESAEAMVAEVFGSLAPRGEPRPEPPDLADVKAANPSIWVFTDPGLGGASLSFQHPLPDPRTADTHDRRVLRLHRALSFAMFQQRLSKIGHNADGSFVASNVSTQAPIPGWELPAVGVNGKIDNWQQIAASIEQEHRRVFQFGFTTGELAEAKANFATAYEQAVRSKATRPSPWLAGQLAGVLLYGGAFATPETLQADLAADLAQATTADCAVAFREAWSQTALHVFVAAHPSFQISPTQLAAVLNESRQQKVSPPENSASVAFAYTDFGPPGKLVRDATVADLDLRLARFANGVRLNFKSTTFEADSVEVLVRVGDGKLSQPVASPGLDLLANAALPSGGLRRHSVEELKSVFAGRAFGVRFFVGSDAFVFAARCARRDLAFVLQFVTAHLTESAYRPEALRDAHASFGSMYSSLMTSPGGPITMRAVQDLASGDLRFGIPPTEKLYARTLAEVSAWLEPQFKRGAIELSVVGDISWAEAVEAAAGTLGALPPRGTRPSLRQAGRISFPKKPRAIDFFTDPKLKQAAVAWYWPVDVPITIRQERRWSVLAAVFSERLRQRLREELGTAYSPTGGMHRAEGFPRFNYLGLYAEVEPARLKQVVEIIRTEAQSLREKGMTEDEFLRAKQPFVRQRLDDLRTNSYWCYTVLSDVQQRPENLNAARDRTSDTAAITRAEIEKLARAYLNPDRGFLFTATPASPLFWNQK